MKNGSLDFSTEYCQHIFHAAFHKEMNIHTWFSASGGWYVRMTVFFLKRSKCYSGLTGQEGGKRRLSLGREKVTNVGQIPQPNCIFRLWDIDKTK